MLADARKEVLEATGSASRYMSGISQSATEGLREARRLFAIKSWDAPHGRKWAAEIPDDASEADRLPEAAGAVYTTRSPGRAAGLGPVR